MNIKTLGLHPNHQQLMRDGWREVASVTTGGKPFFYFKPGMFREWIVWNRVTRQWEHQVDDPPTVSVTG